MKESFESTYEKCWEKLQEYERNYIVLSFVVLPTNRRNKDNEILWVMTIEYKEKEQSK